MPPSCRPSSILLCSFRSKRWFPIGLPSALPLNVAVLVVRRRDLAVRAYVSGAELQRIAGMVDLVRAVRSPGSALKPIIYGLAFEDLVVHPNTVVGDNFINVGGYTPENFDKTFRGEVLVREALMQSLNTVAVLLLNEIGPERFLARLRAAGANVELPDPHKPAGLPIALGGLGISLENLARLFAAIGNGGRSHALRYLASTSLDTGALLMPPASAWAVTDILADMPPPRGGIALVAADGGRRVAYKTGTSYRFKDAWAVGFDAEHVIAVWVGRPDGIGRSGETGATNAVPIMYRVFAAPPNASPRRCGRTPAQERPGACERSSGPTQAVRASLAEEAARLNSSISASLLTVPPCVSRGAKMARSFHLPCGRPAAGRLSDGMSTDTH